MRFAFISDIHGNLHALDLVLADLQHASIDQIVCLGDVASLGPQPREVIARLRQLQLPIIQGNHENYLLNPHLTTDQPPWLRASEIWCLEQLSTDDLNFLGSFQAQLSFNLTQNSNLLCFHGSPRSNEEFIYPDASAKMLDEIFNGQAANILVGGHTHVQMLRQYGTKTLLNPGSVGMPFEFPLRGSELRAIRRAEYAIMELTDDKLMFNLFQLPLDFEYLAQTARKSGMPDAEFWLATWGQ